MIKKLLLSAAAFLFVTGLMAQIQNPVKWAYTAKKIADKTYELHVTATLDPKWHIYAQDAGEGPEPTTISFEKNPLVKLVGKVNESGKLEKAYDPNFKSTLRFYSNQVSFIQKVTVKSTASTIVKGTVSYMVCDDHKCLPPKDIPFAIQVGGK